MTRLAFVCSAAQMSGVEFSTLYLAERLDRTRWQPLVICPPDGPLGELCRAQQIPVRTVELTRTISTGIYVGKRRLPNPLAFVYNPLVLFRNASMLAGILRAERAEVVLTKGLPAQFFGGMAARLAGVPCVWQVQDLVSERLGGFFPLVLAGGGRLLARECIADGAPIARQLERLVPRKRITVIWNGVDTRVFSPEVDGAAVRAEWTRAADELLIGMVARLTPWKGQATLLTAFAQLADEFPNARVVLVGSPMFDKDDYARRLSEQAARAGLAERVVFAGFRSDMPQVLAALDVVAHTALEKDTSPLAVVSAMAAGKPIVCSSVAGTAELFEDGVDGLLYPPGDAAALAERLRGLLADPTARKRLGRAARAKAVRELDLDTYARRCEAVLTRALNE